MKNTFILLTITLVFSSCFKHYVEFEVTSKWNYEKMKKITTSKKKLVVYFTNNLKTISEPELNKDSLWGMVDSYHPTYSTDLAYATRTDGALSRKEDPPAEVHVFVSEEYKGQDRVVISGNNLIQMREYRPDRSADIIGSLGTTLAIMILITLALGTLAYNAYIKASSTLSL